MKGPTWIICENGTVTFIYVSWLEKDKIYYDHSHDLYRWKQTVIMHQQP